MSVSMAEVNWIAVIVAAVASFLIGGVCYGALFGALWPKLHGYDNEEMMKKLQQAQGSVFGKFFVCYLLMAAVMALALTGFTDPNWLTGMGVGFLAWLGVGLPETGIQNSAHRKPMAAFLIDTGHQMAYLVVTGAILGAWR